MAIMQEFHFRSPDGRTQLYGRWWAPEFRTPVAVLQIVHGLQDHIGRYERFAVHMAEQGVFVVGEDHLGHGHTARSPKDLGYTAKTDGWRRMEENTRALMQLIKHKYGHLPYFLLGHSMGSMLIRTLMIDYPGEADGYLLSGTIWLSRGRLLWSSALCWIEKLLRGGRNASPRLERMSFGPPRLSVDLSVLPPEDYRHDPLCTFHPSITLFSDIFDGMRYIQSMRRLRCMSYRTPILLMSGALDHIGRAGEAAKQCAGKFRAAGCRRVTCQVFPGRGHELLNQRMTRDIEAAIVSFIGDAGTIPPPPNPSVCP